MAAAGSAAGGARRRRLVSRPFRGPRPTRAARRRVAANLRRNRRGTPDIRFTRSRRLRRDPARACDRNRGRGPSQRSLKPERERMGHSISLSLVSHTNAGKTTLARTLLASDVGIVRDEAHVTDEAESFLLARTPADDELRLWDTPGFGDSHRLARRLERSDNPFGWLLGQVWDRLRDRPLYSSQQAIRNVREQADVVLYLVNASEDPAEAGYVEPEMRILDWIGKPVVVLLNQTGRPRPPDEEAAELARWRAATARSTAVREVIQLDAFARCWVQESTLLAAVGRQLPDTLRPAFERLHSHWMGVRRARFDTSMAELARRVARAAH